MNYDIALDLERCDVDKSDNKVFENWYFAEGIAYRHLPDRIRAHTPRIQLTPKTRLVMAVLLAAGVPGFHTQPKATVVSASDKTKFWRGRMEEKKYPSHHC